MTASLRWSFGRVDGMSMFPTLLSGEILRGMKVEGNSLAPGQVVVIQGRDGPFVHRFVRYARRRGLEPLMLTAGDLSGPDRPCRVPAEVIVVSEVLRRGRWVPLRRSRRLPMPPLPGRLFGVAVKLLAGARR